MTARSAGLFGFAGVVQPNVHALDKVARHVDGIVLDEDQPMLGIRTDPFLNSLHDDARWGAILTALGLSDTQVAEIEF